MIFVRRRQSGVALVLVVVVMGMISWILTALAAVTIGLHHQRQVDRAEAAARLISDSAVAFMRVHANDWKLNRPAEPIELDVAELAPPPLKAFAQVSFDVAANRAVCRTVVRFERIGCDAAHETAVPLD